MKYWLLTTEYPPLYGGGIGTYCYHTAQMFRNGGIDVTIFISDNKVNNYEILFEESVRIIRFNNNRSRVGDTLGYYARVSYEFTMIVREIIAKEGPPDFIESQEYLGIAYFLLQFKALGYNALGEVPVIVTLHSPVFLYLKYNREGIFQFPTYWTGEMEKACIRMADLLISPSVHLVEEIRKDFELDPEAVRILRNPYVARAGERMEAGSRNQIIFYGKLTPQKGIFRLLDDLKALWDDGFNQPVTLIGGGDKVYYPEMKTVEQLIRQRYKPYLDSGLLAITGKIRPSEIATYFATARVVLIPSLHDNLPYAGMEAMQLSNVVLASRQGGQAEIIDNGVDGFVFDHDIPGDFGEKLRAILALPDNELKSVRTKAFEKVETIFNYDQILGQKITLLKSLKNNRRQRSTRFRFIHETMPAQQPPDRDVGEPGLLTVVIPYYNLGTYLEECVSSVLKSTFAAIEIIIVNDGSTDQESITVLNKLASLHSLRVLSLRNGGVASARNAGARAARGAFLAFLDADDTVTPDYYSKAIAVLRQYTNVFFVGCWAQYFGNSAACWPAWNPEPPYFLTHNSINSSALVYKKWAFLEAGLNDAAVDYGLEDYESVMHLMAQGFRGVALPEPLFNYRIRAHSMARSLTTYKEMYSNQYISVKYRKLFGAYASDIYNLLNANGPSFYFDNPTFGLKVITRKSGRTLSMIKDLAARNIYIKHLALKARSIYHKIIG